MFFFTIGTFSLLYSTQCSFSSGSVLLNSVNVPTLVTAVHFNFKFELGASLGMRSLRFITPRSHVFLSVSNQPRLLLPSPT